MIRAPLNARLVGGAVLEQLTADRRMNFWRKVDAGGEDACWEWSGFRKRGYGMLSLRGGKKIKAHRVSWMIAHEAEIPSGMCILHHCDNPPCVNPRHLYLGTMADNCRDRDRRNRSPRGSAIPASKLTEEIVAKMRSEHHRDGRSIRSLAKEHGVSHASAASAVMGRTWTHVLEEACS